MNGVLVEFADQAGGVLGTGGLQRLAQVDAGQVLSTQFSFVLPGAADALAERTLAVTVDPYNALVEADETDNLATLTVDMVALRAEPLEVSVGQE